MRVVFLGNHTVGVTALSVLVEGADVVGVVAHPEDPEDGVCYQSVYGYAKSCGLPVIRGRATTTEVADFITNAKPDLIWISDYRYLLPPNLLCIAPLGTINLHPSLLPRYRGRAPINWAILHGETELGLTAHFVDEGMDSGDIIQQERFTLGSYEDVGDALKKLLPLYELITRRILSNLQDGNLQTQKQDATKADYYPARKPKDGLIDWSQSAVQILNLVRAVAAPYPGAFTFIGDTKVIIWKAHRVQTKLLGEPGEVVGFLNEAPIVTCGEGALALDKIELPDDNNSVIEINQKFSNG